jgi:transcription initiation factor IIE alpha subunit
MELEEVSTHIEGLLQQHSNKFASSLAEVKNENAELRKTLNRLEEKNCAYKKRRTERPDILRTWK